MGLAEARQNAGSVDARLAALERQPELDRIPVKPRDAVELPERQRLQPKEAESVHEIRHRRLGKQRHVAEDVVKDIRLLEIVELARLADEVAGWELALAEVLIEDVVRNQTG